MSIASQGADFGQVDGAVALQRSQARLGDFATLMKPRVMSLVVFTALVGLLAAPGHLEPTVSFRSLLCIAGGAGAAGALNMWYDADIDAVMIAHRHAADSARPSFARRSSRIRAYACGGFRSRLMSFRSNICRGRARSPSRSFFTSSSTPCC